MGEGPSSVSALLPWINGGGFVTIAMLFVWLIRTEIPRREAVYAVERKEQRETAAGAIGKVTDTFRDEMRLERQAHREEMHDITTAWEKSMSKLEARLVVNDVKRERNTNG